MTTLVFGEGLERVAVRAITPGIYWITHCLGDLAKDYYTHYFASLPNAEAYSGHRVVDYPFSAFLIRGQRTMLIDTIAPRQQASLLQALEHILGEQPLDYIFISHVELPHAGNTPALQRRYPAARVLAIDEGEQYALHALENARLVAVGEVIDLGGYALEIVDALFVDHGLSQWAYERTTGFLFTADWAHNLHEPARGECFLFLDEMEAQGYSRQLHLDDLKVNAWYQFPWLKWSDTERMTQAIDQLFQTYDVKILAPSHGNIIRQNVPHYVSLLKEGMKQAVAMYQEVHGDSQ
ncbi:MAG: MBL fold metallo-hydrolase [Chloroflexi bacterium]|nr:MAG: MBL fold metallo-hydrolase [Chloroflexota bacterium]